MSSEKSTTKGPLKYVLAKDLDLDIQIHRIVPTILLTFRLLPVTTANPDPTWSAVEFPITQSPQDVSERQYKAAICRSIGKLDEVQTSALQKHIGVLNKQDIGVGIMWLMCDGVYYTTTDITDFTVVLGKEKWK